MRIGQKEEVQLSCGYSITNDELSEWGAVLARWIEVIARHCTYGNATPYAKTTVLEETLSSLLSSAAIAEGCLSAVELPMYKTHTEDGRNDLFIGFPKSGRNYYLEAKYISIEPGDQSAHIKKTLDDACQDARDIDFGRHGIEGHLPIGLLFVAPTYHLGSEREVLDEIERAVRMVGDMDADAVAWCFPKGRRLYRVDSSHPEWPVNPGVLLVMKIASKPT
jgi:hypothetical protein